MSKQGMMYITEQEKYEWACANQGFAGSLDDWLAMSENERQEYENGAAGIPTA